MRLRIDDAVLTPVLGINIPLTQPSPHLDTSSTTTNLPFDKFGSKRLGRSKIHNAQIDTMRAYVQVKFILQKFELEE